MKYHLPPPRELTSCDALVARMAETVQARRQAVAAILAGKPVPAETVGTLTQVLADLDEVGGREAQASLDVAEDQAMALDLTEETRQLENDVVYLEQGREALMKHLGREHHGFRDMVNRGLRLISGQHHQVLLLDADGGLRAPGQRRVTAVQPAWNAVSVSRFALARVEHAVLWSAGPLSGESGLAERLTLPVHVAALAGSLGREHRRTDGESGQASLSAEKSALLAAINDRLLQLLTDPTWRAFAYVGNGLQLCRSETRAARQDALESVDPTFPSPCSNTSTTSWTPWTRNGCIFGWRTTGSTWPSCRQPPVRTIGGNSRRPRDCGPWTRPWASAWARARGWCAAGEPPGSRCLPP